jgi:hypothetical protein
VIADLVVAELVALHRGGGRRARHRRARPGALVVVAELAAELGTAPTNRPEVVVMSDCEIEE